jgi:5'-nucleotidase
MRFLIDQDGVLADWCGGLESMLRLMLHNADDVIDWSTWTGTAPGATQREREAFRKAMTPAGFYAGLKPMPGIREALGEMLAEGHDVHIVTTPDSTNPTSHSDKFHWLERHIGPGWGKRAIMTHDKTLVIGDVLIDDKPDPVGALTVPPWRHVVFDAPYNRHIEDRQRLSSWHNWREVLEWENSSRSAVNSPRARTLQPTIW